jgi:uncharacterized membrane protein
MDSEFIEFALAMVLFIAMLIGAYWFVFYAAIRRDHKRSSEKRSGN